MKLYLDTAELTRKYTANPDDSRRWFVGTTRMASDVSGAVRQRLLKAAVSRFMDTMLKKRWDALGAPRIVGPYPVRTDTGETIEGQVEYRIAHLFKMQDTPKVIRIELDPSYTTGR